MMRRIWQAIDNWLDKHAEFATLDPDAAADLVAIVARLRGQTDEEKGAGTCQL